MRISRRPSCCCSSAITEITIGANFKIYLLRQFCWNRVEFFLQYTGDTDAKNDGPEFWNSNSVIFENFLNFQKGIPRSLLRPIWTIMVAAKLDHSRVLVTKFHQNRSMLKGTSAGQRHTDRQTRLKIRALQVCNRANNDETIFSLAEVIKWKWKEWHRKANVMPLPQESSVGWRKDEARPLAGASAVCYRQCFDTAD